MFFRCSSTFYDAFFLFIYSNHPLNAHHICYWLCLTKRYTSLTHSPLPYSRCHCRAHQNHQNWLESQLVSLFAFLCRMIRVWQDKESSLYLSSSTLIATLMHTHTQHWNSRRHLSLSLSPPQTQTNFPTHNKIALFFGWWCCWRQNSAFTIQSTHHTIERVMLKRERVYEWRHP